MIVGVSVALVICAGRSGAQPSPGAGTVPPIATAPSADTSTPVGMIAPATGSPAPTDLAALELVRDRFARISFSGAVSGETFDVELLAGDPTGTRSRVRAHVSPSGLEVTRATWNDPAWGPDERSAGTFVDDRTLELERPTPAGPQSVQHMWVTTTRPSGETTSPLFEVDRLQRGSGTQTVSPLGWLRDDTGKVIGTITIGKGPSALINPTILTIRFNDRPPESVTDKPVKRVVDRVILRPRSPREADPTYSVDIDETNRKVTIGKVGVDAPLVLKVPPKTSKDPKPDQPSAATAPPISAATIGPPNAGTRFELQREQIEETIGTKLTPDSYIEMQRLTTFADGSVAEQSSVGGPVSGLTRFADDSRPGPTAVAPDDRPSGRSVALVLGGLVLAGVVTLVIMTLRSNWYDKQRNRRVGRKRERARAAQDLERLAARSSKGDDD